MNSTSTQTIHIYKQDKHTNKTSIQTRQAYKQDKHTNKTGKDEIKMDALYKKESNASYLILEKTEKASYFLINMLQENKIPGLLTFEKRSFNGEESFYYDISGKYSLENLVKMRSLKEKDITGLLESLLFTIQTGSSYFLDTGGLLLDFAFIYESDTGYFFCYYPALQEETETEWKVFAENLISCVDHDDEQAVALVYRFYKLVKENTFTVIQILQQLFEEPEKVRQEEFIVPQDEIEKEEWEWEREGGRKTEKRREGEGEKEKKEQMAIPADKEADRNESSHRQKTDWLTLAIFLFLAVGSVSYFLYQYRNMDSFSFGRILSCREGMLAAVFFLLSIPGMLLVLFSEKIDRFLYRLKQH